MTAIQLTDRQVEISHDKQPDDKQQASIRRDGHGKDVVQAWMAMWLTNNNPTGWQMTHRTRPGDRVGEH